jgi:hypothetical protein
MNQPRRGKPPWARVRGAFANLFRQVGRRVVPGARARAARHEQLRASEHQTRLRNATGDTDSTNRPQLMKDQDRPHEG